MKNLWKTPMLIFAALSVFTIMSCGDDDEPTPTTPTTPVASFQFAISDSDFLEVSFTNFSLNATSYSWDFGDGTSSTEENPIKTYGAPGMYTVTLTATNSGGSAMRSETINVADPNEQLTHITGQTSKTWYLLREGIALGIGPAINDNQWWAFGGAATPLAARPCILDDSYTFHRDGTFEFNSAGTFFNDTEANGGWIINGVDEETCHDESESGVWGDNNDRSVFGNGGDYTFTLDNATNILTLNGLGSYIGLNNKTNDGNNNLPVQSKTYEIFNWAPGSIADTLQMALKYPDGYWNFYLVSYHDAANLPDIPTDVPQFGEDLPDFSPTALLQSFAGDSGNSLDTIPSGSQITYGVDDPADATAAKVGEFYRTEANFQELQLQTVPDKMDINFENLSTITLDVYLPSSNDYTGDLTRQVKIGVGDRSQTQEWWNELIEWSSADELPLDEWITLSFNLDSPSFVANAGSGATPFDRNDFDMVYINMGGSGQTHMATGTFYVRNLSLQ